MGKSIRRKENKEKKKYKRSMKYKEGGGESDYSRKRSYLNKHGLWGWEVPAPKPWKRKQD